MTCGKLGKNPELAPAKTSWATYERAWSDVEAEFRYAAKSFTQFNSAHEGWAVIQEELDELWVEVKRCRDSHVGALTREEITVLRSEAIQVAAIALRFVHDVCGG